MGGRIWLGGSRQAGARRAAGVANDGGDEGPLFSERCERPVDALQFLSGHERELLFEPGTHYGYSSYGWIVVSAAVEAAAGEPFLTFMRKQIRGEVQHAGSAGLLLMSEIR